jgi:hypothetical protein
MKNIKKVLLLLLIVGMVPVLSYSCKSRESLCYSVSYNKKYHHKKNRSSYNKRYSYKAKPVRKDYVIKNGRSF